MNIVKLTFTIVVAAASQAALFAGGLVNGGFENPDTLAGWSTETGPGGIETVGGAGVSPFAALGGVSKKAVLLTDTEGSSGRPGMYQTFSVQGPARFSFDFKLSAFSSDFWSALASCQVTDPFPGAYNLFNMRIGDENRFTFISNRGIAFLQPIDLGVWYRVVVDMDFDTQMMSGSLTEFGGAKTTWTNERLLSPVPTIDTIGFVDAAWTEGANGDLYLDNVSVSGVNGAAVPEPATYGLAAVAVLLVLAARRVRGPNRC